MPNLRATVLLLVMVLVVAEISAADEAPVPAYVLQLPDSVAAVLIAETDSAKLHRYERVQGRLKHRQTRYMSIGENGVGKERAWDRRTPLGIYFANEQLDTTASIVTAAAGLLSTRTAASRYRTRICWNSRHRFNF
jgi:hypothetical protein